MKSAGATSKKTAGQLILDELNFFVSHTDLFTLRALRSVYHIRASHKATAVGFGVSLTSRSSRRVV
jgi:hypothetical protein